VGIVEHELANFELSTGTEYRIELNRNGIIHLHIGEIRLDMTVDEFDHFVEVISDAKHNLIAEKNLAR
jgi:mRNA-degrading endonuclease RelE of RelBE toxin-antitoxin system